MRGPWRTLGLALAALGLCAAAQAQDVLGQLRDEKLKAEYLKKAAWITDFDQARAEAKKTGRPIFAFFSRSYVPDPACLELEGGAFLKDEFVQWSKGFVLFNHITTRIEGDKYGDLFEQKGGAKFPLLAYLDAEGNVIAEHFGSRDAAGFAKSGAKVLAWTDAKKRAADGDKSAGFDLLIAELDLQAMPKEQLAQRLIDLGQLTAEQSARLQPAQTLNDIRTILTSTQQMDPASLSAAGRQFAEMHKAGRVPAGGENEALNFWLILNRYADETKDAALMAAAFEVLQKILPETPKKADWIAKERARIQELQGGGK